MPVLICGFLFYFQVYFSTRCAHVIWVMSVKYVDNRKVAAIIIRLVFCDLKYFLLKIKYELLLPIYIPLYKVRFHLTDSLSFNYCPEIIRFSFFLHKN